MILGGLINVKKITHKKRNYVILGSLAAGRTLNKHLFMVCLETAFNFYVQLFKTLFFSVFSHFFQKFSRYKLDKLFTNKHLV